MIFPFHFYNSKSSLGPERGQQKNSVYR